MLYSQESEMVQHKLKAAVLPPIDGFEIATDGSTDGSALSATISGEPRTLLGNAITKAAVVVTLLRSTAVYQPLVCIGDVMDVAAHNLACECEGQRRLLRFVLGKDDAAHSAHVVRSHPLPTSKHKTHPRFPPLW
jgi:hypothetical protein